MKRMCWLFLAFSSLAHFSQAEEIDLFLLAGQSNAQGWMGDALYYPRDTNRLDRSIRFYWVTPWFSSSNGKWTTIQAQGGQFRSGHFGPEVTFARCLKEAGYNPAVFKYTLGSTSIAQDWRGPGDGGMYDQMVANFKRASELLRKQGHTIHARGFVWIQGESDAATRETADAYQARLRMLLDDLRRNVIRNPELTIILGVDEQHPYVVTHPQVVHAQQALAKEMKQVVFTSMIGLEKADPTHLTPKGLEEHGRRIFAAYRKIAGKADSPGSTTNLKAGSTGPAGSDSHSTAQVNCGMKPAPGDSSKAAARPGQERKEQ